MSNQHSEHKLGEFLKEVANWKWSEFVLAEKDHDHYTTADAIVFSLIRACVMQDIAAIKLAINRLDGKLATPVKIVYPKFYYLFPNAKSVALDAPTPPPITGTQHIDPDGSTASMQISIQAQPDEDYQIIMKPAEESETMDESDLPTLTFRQTLSKMVDYPRSLPKQLIQTAFLVHAMVEKRKVDGEVPYIPERNIPMVKSVVAAHLIQMAERRDIDALYEVFEAIDGKLVETIQVVGEDVYLTLYHDTAPFGAIKNEDGVYQIEATSTQNRWRQKLGGEN